MKRTWIALGLLVLLSVGAPAVLAHTDEPAKDDLGVVEVSNPDNSKKNEISQAETPVPDVMAAKIARDETKESQGKAKTDPCEKRQAAVSRIMLNLINLGERQVGTFDDISSRVQKFYKDQDLSSEDYGDAVAVVTAARGEVMIRLDDMRDTQVEFKCEGTDPMLKVNLFREHLHSLIDALKNYRSATKDLILIVRSAAGGEQAASMGQPGMEPEPSAESGASDE